MISAAEPILASSGITSNPVRLNSVATVLTLPIVNSISLSSILSISVTISSPKICL